MPTFKSGVFDDWFDSLSPQTVKRLWKNKPVREAIEGHLRGDGGLHEYLMVATAPHWKKWGVKMKDVRKMSIEIDKLNRGGVAKGWTHSTGPLNPAPGSKRVHNELQKVILNSNSLKDFKKNIKPWASKNFNGGASRLPPILKGG